MKIKRISSKVLIIRFSALGDCVLLIPIIVQAVKKYPNTEFYFLTNWQTAQILPKFSNLKFVFLEENSNKILSFLKLIYKLKSINFGTILDCHNVIKSIIIRILFFYKKSSFLDKQRYLKKYVLESKNENVNILHISKKYLEVFKKQGFDIDFETITPLKRSEFNIQNLLNLSSRVRIIGIAPFSKHPSKEIPINKIHEIINYSDKEKYFFLILGFGKREYTLAEELSKKYINTLNIIDKYSFDIELKIISNLDSMISCDSFNGHLSSIYNVNTVTIWISTSPIFGFYPLFQPFENNIIPKKEKFQYYPMSIFGNVSDNNYTHIQNDIDILSILNKI